MSKLNSIIVNRIPKFPVSLLAGFILNVVLVNYVYFAVEGGPAAIDLLGILNEVPQTILMVLVGVLMPYVMVWSKCRSNVARLSLVCIVMLTATVINCVIIALAQRAVSKEIALDIGWVILWAIAMYFVLIPQRSS